MSEQHVVIIAGVVRHTVESEAEAISKARDEIAEMRISGGGFDWGGPTGSYADSVKVAKVLYESRACEFAEPTEKQRREGYTHACDYQMFPIEEPDDGAPSE